MRVTGKEIRREAVRLLQQEPMTAEQLAHHIGVSASRVIQNLYNVKRIHNTGVMYQYLSPDDPRVNSVTIQDALDSSEWYPTIFGQRIMHSWAEIAFLEQTLTNYKPRNIVELGTASGGLTTFFMMHSIATGANVTSIDINREPNTEPYNTLKNNSRYLFIQGNAINPEHKTDNLIKTAIQRTGRTLLYCDANGYREARREQAEHWIPYMKPRDIVMLHDYPIQITEEDMTQLCKEYNLTPFHQEEAWRMGCRMLTYERKK